MRILGYIIFSVGVLLEVGCSPVKTPVTNEYQLSSLSLKKFVAKPRPITLMVSVPEAVPGYQTEEMLYIKKPFQVEPFAKNAWSSPPADMLFPLLIESLEATGFFYAVTSSPYSDEADYRLDTQLLHLEQNFLKKPSVIQLTVKVVLSRTDDKKIIASRIISKQVSCTQDTPYGGVIAANQAAYQFTAAVSDFVISHIKRD